MILLEEGKQECYRNVCFGDVAVESYFENKKEYVVEYNDL